MNKTKKIIIGIVLTICLIGTAIVAYLYFNKPEHDNNNTNKNNVAEKIEYTQTDDGPGFFCSNTPLGPKPFSYVIGEYVYCRISFEINASKPGIQEIWAEYSLDEDVEYVQTLDTSNSGWTLKEDGNKFHLTTDRPTAYAEYFYQVQFRIKPTTKKEKVTIEFKDIKYKDSENNYYKTDSSKQELNIEKATSYYYKENDKNNEFTFYKLTENEGYKQINKYSCKTADACYIYASQCTSYIDLEKGKILLMDDGKAILYDFNKGIIGTYELEIDNIGDYLIAKDIKNQKYGIVDTDGKIIKEFISDGYGEKKAPCFNKDTYSIKNDLIVEKKNDKYGIIKITKDEVVIEHQFDSIRLFDNKYFKAKQEDKWYLYSMSTKSKILEEGYKELFIVTDEIIITMIDNQLYIKDYQGNNIIENGIEVFMEYNEQACCGAPSGIYIEEKDGIINIYIEEKNKTDEYGYNTHQYEYNIKNKQLTKKDSTN